MKSFRIEEIGEENVDDVFRVCSHDKLNSPLQQMGVSLKRRWLLEMMTEYGSCTKIAYKNGKPVAQILFYPEEAVPFTADSRKGVVVLQCAYNPFPEARGRGVGSALLRSLVDDCGSGLSCLGGGSCKFIVAKPFNTGEGIPLDKFYAAKGFTHASQEMFLEITARYMPRRVMEYRPLPEDEGRAAALYNPMCEYSYPFAVKVRELIGEVDPSLPVDLINEWQCPEESIRRGNHWLVVNATPIGSFPNQREVFRREIKQALDR